MTGKPLVILQHEAIGPPGGIATALRHLGVPFEVRRCDLGEPLPTWPTDTSGVISLGGYMHVTQRDEFPFLAEEQDLLRQILDDGGPVWGICLGAQLLTLAAGGEVRRRVTPAVGWATIHTVSGDPFFEGIGRRFVAFNWREYTCVPPSGAQHLAQGVDEVQAFRVGGMGWATQFHPEIDEQMAPRWVHDAASEHLVADAKAAARLRTHTTRYLPESLALCRHVVENFARASGSLAR